MHCFLVTLGSRRPLPPTPKKKRKAVLTENIVEEVAVVVVGLKTLLQGGPTLQQKNHMHPDTKPTPVFSNSYYLLSNADKLAT